MAATSPARSFSEPTAWIAAGRELHQSMTGGSLRSFPLRWTGSSAFLPPTAYSVRTLTARRPHGEATSMFVLTGIEMLKSNDAQDGWDGKDGNQSVVGSDFRFWEARQVTDRES